ATEDRTVRKRDRLGLLFIRLLHHELLRLARTSCKNQCSDSGDYRKRFVSHFIFHQIALSERRGSGVRCRGENPPARTLDSRPSTLFYFILMISPLVTSYRWPP